MRIRHFLAFWLLVMLLEGTMIVYLMIRLEHAPQLVLSENVIACSSQPKLPSCPYGATVDFWGSRVSGGR